jgi:hypothetical protein
VLWIFGDTFLGTVRSDGARAPGSPVVHNSFVLERGGCIATVHGGTRAEPTAMISPRRRGDWFWPGGAIATGNVLYVVLDEYRGADTGLSGFHHVGDSVATFSVPGFRLLRVSRLPTGGNIAWGASVVTSGRYAYVYGVEDLRDGQKYTHLARAPVSQVGVASAWRFHSRRGWSRQPHATARIIGGVSDLFSVVRARGSYLLISQEPYPSRVVVVRSARRPAGPWSTATPAATLPDPGTDRFVYNAVVHPEFSTGQNALLGYSVNAYDPAEYYSDVSSYRPRFLRIRVPARIGR